MSSIITFASLIVNVIASGIVTQTNTFSNYGTIPRYPWYKQEGRVRNRPSNLLTLQDFFRNSATMQHVGANVERKIKTDDHIGKVIEETEGKEVHTTINREGMKVRGIGEESVNASMYRAREEGTNKRKQATELRHGNGLQTMNRNNFETNMSIDGRENQLRSPDNELNNLRDSTDYGANFRNSWRPFHDSSVVDEKHLIENQNPVESLKYVISSLKEITSQYDGDISLNTEDTNTTLKNNILKGIEIGIEYLKSGFRGVLMEGERLIDDYFDNGTRNKHFNSDTNTHLRANKRIYVYDREGYAFPYPPYERSEQDGKVRDERHVVERMDTDIDGFYGGDMEQLSDNMEVRMLGDKRSNDTRNVTTERSESSGDYIDLPLDCLLSSSECDDEDDADNSSYGVAEFRKRKDKKEKRRKKLMEKILLPLLISYKLKFFALIPVLVSGLVLLVGSTGLAGFFIALFAAVLTIKLQHQS